MSLLTDDTMQSISSITEENLKINIELTETIDKLEEIFNSNHTQPPQDFFEQIELLIKLSDEVRQTNDFSYQMDLAKRINKEVREFILKFQDFLPNESLKEFDISEINFKQIKAELAIRLTIQKFTELYGEENTQNKDMVLYNFLRELSVLLEKYIPYLSEEVLQAIRQFAKGVINSLDKHHKDEKIEWVFSIFKNVAKGILWEIDSYITKRKEIFPRTKSIIKFLEEKPGWEWDNDLEECLKYVNEIR